MDISLQVQKLFNSSSKDDWLKISNLPVEYYFELEIYYFVLGTMC